MKQFEEGSVLFRFGERWQIEKWDTSAVYKRIARELNGELTDASGSARPEGTKAVDFVGVLDNDKLYLFEVKDFRGHHIENKRRHLPLEIGLKVRDTLAGLAGEYVRGGGAGWVKPCGQALSSRRHQVRVVAWILDDSPGPREPVGKRAAHDSVRAKQIQQKLSWLTSRVMVEDPFESTIEDTEAENLPGAGR